MASVITAIEPGDRPRHELQHDQSGVRGDRERGRARLARRASGSSTPAGPRVMRASPSQSQEGARGAAAMADRVLLLDGQLGHRAAVVAVGGHERRVVAEAAVAARLVRELTLAALGEHARLAARLGVRQRAHVGHAAIAVVGHLVQQLRQVLLVAGALAGVARRPHPGPAVRARRPRSRSRRRPPASPVARAAALGLHARVLLERLARLRRQLDVVRQRHELVRRRAARGTRAACARCAWRGRASRRERVRQRPRDRGLRGADLLDPAAPRARAARPARRATAACARRWPAPRRGRRRPSSPRSRPPRPSSPPGSRGRAARGRPPSRTRRRRSSRSAASARACPPRSAGERELERHVAAADRRRARAAVGLEHVAVDPHRALAQRREVDHARAASGRSAAGSRRCGRRRGPSRRRAAFARRWTPGASRTRPSPSRGPCRPSTSAPTRRPTRCRSRACRPSRSAPSRWRCA